MRWEATFVTLIKMENKKYILEANVIVLYAFEEKWR